MSRSQALFVQPSLLRLTRQSQLSFAQHAGCHSWEAERAPRATRPLRFVPQCRNGKKRPRSEKRPRQSSSDASMLPDFGPLGPSPVETSGFDGWREEDDAYWRDVRESIVIFRATNTFDSEDLESPPQPLDRYGNPITYPAAAKYDQETKRWVPTSEEEEERLKRPNPIRDPYFIPEAADNEIITNLRNDPNREEKSKVSDWRPIEEPEQPPIGVEDPATFRRRRLKWGPRGWKVVHLGTSSAVPTRKRNVSSTAFLVNDADPAMFLVDAGENTSRRLLQCNWCMTHGFRWIRAVFVTHLHGDHIYGLPALLSSIGRFAQYRRRAALENGDDGSDPVIRIYGPYGTRGYVRSSLFWTNPIGVRFSVSELVPRNTDFCHIRQTDEFQTEMFIEDSESGDVTAVPPLNVYECPPPHPEEVRADDIRVGEDGVWHVWEDKELQLEVVAAPLKHRLPCFGYVFREPSPMTADHSEQHPSDHDLYISNGVASNGNPARVGFEIDKDKARALGVYGSQFGVLRSGRSVTASKSGLTVRPEDVALTSSNSEEFSSEKDSLNHEKRHGRKVTILGDTCDSKLISEAARRSDLLVHEATFTDILKMKARVAMHSTARMAGEFGKSIEAKKIALTHFSSRHEVQLMDETSVGEAEDYEEDDEEDEDFASPNQLISEAREGYGDGDAEIVAAYDFMEHDIPARNIGRQGSTNVERTVQTVQEAGVK